VLKSAISRRVFIRFLNRSALSSGTLVPYLSFEGETMNRRSFLWQGLCTSLPLLARASFSQQVAALPVSKPTDADLTAFARGLTGNVFRSGDPKYEQLRKGYAAKFDARPALVVHPVNPQDVQATLSFASSNHLPLAVRCGGHSYAGYSTCEGGLVLDMSGFRSMAIAPDKGHARIGGGMLCGAVEIETARAGVAAVLGQCPSVGVGGFLLGGGVGPLMSKYRLGCDNILVADLVLADGRLVKASPHENIDLYWAIRGGGGNFGIVTEFEVALHPVSRVFAGNITLESADPRQCLRAFRDFLPMAPDELTLIALMSAEPNHKSRLEIQACYVGGQDGGEKVLAPLRHHPAVVVHDTVQLRPYLELEQMVPAEIPPSYEDHCSGFFAELDERRIEIFANAFTSAPFPVDCFLIHLHGAVTRVPEAATPFPLRRDGIACDVAAYWKAPDGQRATSEWIEALKSNLPVDEVGNYVNVMERAEESSVRRAYGANYARLQQVKARYDPHNLFSLNQNIRPA
jgi:FAD/FMN-containing dehydrogenase